jgi:DNA-binding response OmpR family regulator
MTINILVVDSSEQFGTLVQQSLEADGGFEVTVATSASDAMHITSIHGFRLAIVDLELPRNAGLDLLRIWSNQKPEMSLVAVPLAGNTQILQSLDVPIHGVLYKPFYLPDLPAIIQSALASSPVLHGANISPESADMAEPAQPADPATISTEVESDSISDLEFDTVLTAMKEATDGKQVLAVLITRNGQPWTDIGVLSPDQKHAILSRINQILQVEGLKTEVVQYVDIIGLDEAPLLYLTPLQGERELGVLLSPFVSIAFARQVAKKIAEALLGKPEIDSELLQPSDGVLEIEEAIPVIATEIPLPLEPPQDPGTRMPKDWIPQKDELPLEEMMEGKQMPEISRDTLPTGEVDPIAEPVPAKDVKAVDLPKDWIPEPETRAKYAAQKAPPVDRAGFSQPSVQAAGVASQILLPYSLVLIPRFPEHRLVGALSEKIRTWSLRLSIAWDWRMINVSMEPDYLSFTVQLSPEIPPAAVVDILREELSKKIMTAYPDLLSDLPSERFWASSYLLLTGPAPPQDEIRAFISAARTAQGL